MFLDLSKVQLFVKAGPTDMRKQSAGLAAVVQEEMELDPFQKALFIFCNRKRTLMKAVYWDRNGFCLWQKRLEQDTFPWPTEAYEVHQISARQWRLLLDGLNIWKAHRELEYTKVT